MSTTRAPALQLELTPNHPSTPSRPLSRPLSPMRKAFAVVACHLMRVYWIVASFVWPLICWIKSLWRGAKRGDQSAPNTRPPSRRRTPASTPIIVSIPLEPTDQALDQATIRRKPAALSIPPPYEEPKSFCPPISPPSSMSSQESASVCTPTVECNTPKSRFSLFRFKSSKSKKRSSSVAGSETTSTPPPPDATFAFTPTDGESVTSKPSKLGFMVRRRATEPNAEAPRPKPKKRFSGLGGLFGPSAPPDPPRRTNPYAAPYFCPTPDEVKQWELRGRKDSARSVSDASTTPTQTRQRSRPPISRPPAFKRTGSDGALFDPSITKPTSRTAQCVRFVSGDVSDSGNQTDTLIMRAKSLRRITQRIPPRQTL